MRQKISFMLITAILMFVSFSSRADIIESGKCGNDVTWSLSEDGTLTIAGNGETWDYDGVINPWADYKEKIVKIEIEEGVTYIGNYLFSFLRASDGGPHPYRNVKSMTFPKSLKRFGNYTFFNFHRIETLRIASDLSSWCKMVDIGKDALIFKANHIYLDNNEISRDLVIPDDVEKIADYAFRIFRLNSVTIPSSVKSVGNYAFAVQELTTVKMASNSVEDIGIGAFRNCPNLTSIEIPNSLREIGRDAFFGCDELKFVYITDLAKWCELETASGLLNNVGEETYKLKEKHLFLNGSEIKELVIPGSVTKIYPGAFANLTELRTVVIPNSVLSIGESAFKGCKELTSVTLGNSIQKIDEMAFYKCENLCSIILPNSVTYIGRSAFSRCRGLNSVIIPNSVTYIGNAAFLYCKGLNSVIIPNSVTYIGGGAFEGCTSLKSVIIPNSVTYIGRGAFSGCKNLSYVSIGSSVKNIELYAFYDCIRLTEIVSKNPTPPQPTDWGISEYMFDIYNYDDATLKIPIGSAQTYKNTYEWSRFVKVQEVDFAGVEPINDNAVKVSYMDGEIIVDGVGVDEPVEVYSTTGQQVYQGISKTIHVPTSGIYIVKTANTTRKVVTY